MNNSGKHLLGFCHVKTLCSVLRILLITGAVLFSCKGRTKIPVVNACAAETITDHTTDFVTGAMRGPEARRETDGHAFPSPSFV